MEEKEGRECVSSDGVLLDALVQVALLCVLFLCLLCIHVHAQAAVMVGHQPMLWVINRSDVRTTVPALARALGLEGQQQQQQAPQDAAAAGDAAGGVADAATLAERMPVLLACETDWLRLK